MGIDEAIFYDSGKIAVVPMAFCFPGYVGTGPTGKGADRPPPKVCAERWRDEVMGLVLSKLRLVLLVGAYAHAWHLGVAPPTHADRDGRGLAGHRGNIERDRSDSPAAAAPKLAQHRVAEEKPVV